MPPTASTYRRGERGCGERKSDTQYSSGAGRRKVRDGREERHDDTGQAKSGNCYPSALACCSLRRAAALPQVGNAVRRHQCYYQVEDDRVTTPRSKLAIERSEPNKDTRSSAGAG